MTIAMQIVQAIQGTTLLIIVINMFFIEKETKRNRNFAIDLGESMVKALEMINKEITELQQEVKKLKRENSTGDHIPRID